MTLSPTECVVLASEETNSASPIYHVSSENLPVVRSVRDLGVRISADLDHSAHILEISKAGRTLVNSIFRCFVVRNPEFYLRLFQSLVVSRLLYCCPVWLPHAQKHIRMLQTVQSYFLRRLHLRCAIPLGTTVLPPIETILSDQDGRTVRRLIAIGLSDHFFSVRRNSRKTLCSVLPKGPTNKYLVRYFCEVHLYPTFKCTKLIIIHPFFYHK